MKTAAAEAPDAQRPTRQDGEQSRERLLRAGLALFAQHGYAKASTREIAEAAQTNIAAISYYFGDKAGLYRAAFFETQGAPEDEIARYAQPALTLNQSLRGLYTGFLEPLKHGDKVRQCMKLHMREMLEPTGLWEEVIHQGIKPMHDALVAVLCRHFGLTRADDDLRRLAFCIAGQGVHLQVCGDIIDALAPRLSSGTKAIDLWMERLVMYAEAMVAAEAQRRRLAGPAKGAAKK